MRQVLSIFLIALTLTSCKEDEEPGTDNSNSIAIGSKIYTIEQGADQFGARGQFLEEDIKISITDFEGRAMQANLSLELSSDDGYVYAVTNSEEEEEGEEDWLVYRWKLGCADEIQTLTISDNVCDISRDGCVDVVIFELTVDAGQPGTGWIEACYEFNTGYSGIERLLVHEGELLAYTNYDLFVTTDVSTNGWNQVNTSTQLDEYTDVWQFENGDMIYENSYALYLSENNGRSWQSMYLPGYYYDLKRATILSNGDYVAIVEYSSAVYLSSDNGNNWTTIISDIGDLTGTYSSSTRTVVSEGNKVFIITNDSKVIEYEDGITTLHEFPTSSWSSASMDDYYALAKSGKIILQTYSFSTYTATTLDLVNNQVTSALNLDDAFYLSQDQGNIYILPNQASDYYYKYNNGVFDLVPLNLPEVSSYYSGQVAIFNGDPVYYSNSSSQLYYYND